jgi:hypothetical protein
MEGRKEGRMEEQGKQKQTKVKQGHDLRNNDVDINENKH